MSDARTTALVDGLLHFIRRRWRHVRSMMFVSQVLGCDFIRVVVDFRQIDGDDLTAAFQFIFAEFQEWAFFPFRSITSPFIHQQLDGLTDGKLQTFRNTVSELVAVFFQLFKQDFVGFAIRTKRAVRQKRGDVVERVFFFATKCIVEIERQESSLCERVAIQ